MSRAGIRHGGRSPLRQRSSQGSALAPQQAQTVRIRCLRCGWEGRQAGSVLQYCLCPECPDGRLEVVAVEG